MDNENNNTIVSKAFILFLSLLFISRLSALTPLPPEKPKLIVNIVADNLSIHDIEKNRHLFGTDGILRLLNEGTKFTNAYYPYSTHNTESDYTTLVTGTTPRHHGIVGGQWYKPSTEDYVSSVASKKHITVGYKKTSKAYDASKITCSTIGDELKLQTQGKAKVFAVSLKPTAAVLLGGHAADAVYWLDDKSGYFVSSDYYLPWLPDWTEEFNKKKFTDFYLSQDWVLFNEPEMYDYPKVKNSLPISLMSSKSELSTSDRLASSPMGNMLLADFILELIEQENLGQDEISDLLNIAISDITDSKFNIVNNSIEEGDYIVRLDKEIDRIIKLLDKKVGSHNYIVTLVSTQNKGLSSSDLKKHRIPTGIFDPEKSVALLNSYLMAVHGQGNWILDYSNQQIYLNQTLIEKSNLNFQDFQEQVAEFMEDFSGVKWAIPAYKLKYADFNEGDFMYMQEAFSPGRSGDLMLEYYPGWAEKGKTNNYTTSHNTKTSTLLMYGWKCMHKTSTTRIKMTSLAPTLSAILGTDIPNSSNQSEVIINIIQK